MISFCKVHQKPASLPKFGGWDESDRKAEYTVIFNEVKEKKQTAATKLPAVPTNAGDSKDTYKASSKVKLKKKLYIQFIYIFTDKKIH